MKFYLIAVLFMLMFVSNAIAGGFAQPGSIQIMVPGSGCDERPFSGKVTSSTLKETNGDGADVIEIHYRPGKSDPYKAKRLRVKSDNVAYPMQWKTGACVRIYSKTPFTENQLNTLLTTDEKIKFMSEAELDSNVTNTGHHFTEGLLMIVTQ